MFDNGPYNPTSTPTSSFNPLVGMLSDRRADSRWRIATLVVGGHFVWGSKKNDGHCPLSAYKLQVGMSLYGNGSNFHGKIHQLSGLADPLRSALAFRSSHKKVDDADCSHLGVPLRIIYSFLFYTETVLCITRIFETTLR